jgi:hypothetical protein
MINWLPYYFLRTVLDSNRRRCKLYDYSRFRSRIAIEFVVGSDDYSIRVYKDEQMIFDISEESKVNFLSKIQNASFSFALNNGTIGLYSGNAQKWSIKVDNRVTSLLEVGFEMDGSLQLMIGYQSGNLKLGTHQMENALIPQTWTLLYRRSCRKITDLKEPAGCDVKYQL